MCPKTPEQNEEIRQQSMQNIMNAAFVLFAKSGYESTSIAQIAKEAGVSKGLLYNYFDSKEDLLKALVKMAMSEGDKIAAEVVTSDPRETLRNLFNWYFRDLVERNEHWKLITELTFKINKFDFVHDMATAKMNEYGDFIENLLAQIGFENPKNEARLIMALFDGLGVQHLIVKDDLPLEEIKHFLIEKYCGK